MLYHQQNEIQISFLSIGLKIESLFEFSKLMFGFKHLMTLIEN